MKNEIIAKYIRQLKTMGDQQLDIPSGYEKDFWHWFEKKSRIYDSKKITKSIYTTSAPIETNNFCFKNSYRIAKAFVKRLYFFEGFTYQINNDDCIRHAF